MKAKIPVLLFLITIFASSTLFSQSHVISEDDKNIDFSFSSNSGSIPLDTVPFWQTTIDGIYTTGMIWRDCNLDGFIDVFFSNGNDMSQAVNQVYLSDRGTLPLSPSWSSSNADYSGHCAVGDIDDNGRPDFIVANYLGNGRFTTFDSLQLYYNYTGLPTFEVSWKSVDTLESFSCITVDIDNDGDLDVATATGDGYEPILTPDKIFYNLGGYLESMPSWESNTNTAAIDVTCGDIDNDGDLDLAFASDGEGAYIFYNYGDSVETIPSWVSTHAEPANTLIFGDVNNDGWLDLVVAYNNQLGSGGYFRMYLNNGAGHINNTSADWTSATGGYGSAVALYDYDNDGDKDLATGRWFQRVTIYENIGGTFTTSPVWQTKTSLTTEEIAWVDVDADGVEIMVDTMMVDGSKKLFYTKYNYLYAVDSVVADGVTFGDSDYCYDLVDGWISLAVAPATELLVYYKYSFKCDLAVSDWSSENSVFGNTNKPNVAFYADNPIGSIPHTVNFYDSSLTATEWLWDFGNGATSNEPNPTYTYTETGAYDISLRVLLADGYHTRFSRQLILATADTLKATDGEGEVNTPIEVVVSVRNNFPLYRIVVPVEYSGALLLKYDSISVNGCRTDYFQSVKMIHYDGFYHRLTVELKAANNLYYAELPPGEGDILKIYFHIISSNPTATTDLVFDGYDSYQPLFMGSVVTFSPVIDNAVISEGSVSCCVGLRGNIDGDVEDIIDIEDLVYFIDYSFRFGDEPPCLEEADFNADGIIDIEDIVAMVDYQFSRPGAVPPEPCF